MLPIRIVHVLTAISVVFSVAASLGQQPLGQQPLGQQPLGQQPLGQQPWGQQQPVQPVAYLATGDATDQRLAQMQQEIDALRGRLDRGTTGGECLADTCGSPCGGGLYAGAAVVFAKPYYKESFEAASLSLQTGQMDLLGFNFDYDATPRVWLGYSGSEGLGIRAMYWQYDHSAQPRAFTADGTTVYSAQAMTVIFPATIAAATPGDILAISSRLGLQTFDLEGTQDLRLGSCLTRASAGLRYSSLEQRSSASVTSGGITTQQLGWSRTYRGVGPTVAIDLRRPLGFWGLEGVAVGRGALLYGKTSLNRQVSPPSQPNPAWVTLRDADDVTGCGSLELGAQWVRQLACGGQLFVRGTYEGQLWTEAGAPTLTFLGVEGFGLTCGLAR